MATCTAPTRGHRTASAAADCPACSSRYSGQRSYSAPSYSSPRDSGGGYSSGRSSGSSRPRWSRANSSLSYTSAQVQSLTPIRETVETRAAQQPDVNNNPIVIHPNNRKVIH